MSDIYITPPTFAHLKVYESIKWFLQIKKINPSIREVAKEAGFGWTWTNKMINDLEKLGVIEKTFKKKRDFSLVPHYKLAVNVDQRDLIKK